MVRQGVPMAEVVTKTVFLFTPRVCSNFIVTNVASGQTSSYDGHTLAQPHVTQQAKDVINSLGAVQVFFPLLEISLGCDTSMLDGSCILCLR